MCVKKLGIRILFLTILIGMTLISTVYSQEEDNFSVTAGEAFEQANAFMISYPNIGFENWKKASIDPKPLELYDINGQKLYYQFSVYGNNEIVGKINVAANKTLGRQIQMIEHGLRPFNATEAMKRSIEIAKNEYPDGEIKSTKMVVYHYDINIAAMTVIKDNSDGNEHRIFVDARTLDVVEDKPVIETEPGIWYGVCSIYEQIPEYEIDENLKEWQKRDNFTKYVEHEAASKEFVSAYQ